MAEHEASPIRLESIAGPPTEAIEVLPGEPVVIGRAADAQRQLTDKTVSRRHSVVAARGLQWFITDLNSRHGTYLNGMKLEGDQPAPLGDGDLVRVGPWTFRVRLGQAPGASMPTTNDLASTAHRVQRVPARELRSLAQQRLDLLVECAAGINSAATVESLADQALDAVMRGTGFSRAAFVRQVSSTGDVEVIAFRAPGVDGGGGSGGGSSGTAAEVGATSPRAAGRSAVVAPSDFSFSRSLINAASEGEIVRMAGDSGLNYGESIIRLGIHSALCAPVMLGTSVEAYLYLDARDSESSVQPDAAAFCQAVSRMSGLALANIKRLKLEKDKGQLDADLQAARVAQRLIMPPAMGEFGALRYAMQTKPGRVVAGDLFDVVPLDTDGPGGTPRRVAVFLGDVAGKGVGAAILMATAQTQLRMGLRLSGDPGEVVSDANRFLAGRVDERVFISLWLGVFDLERGEVAFVDAGHGHWLAVMPGGKPGGVQSVGGLPLGVKPDAVYRTERMAFAPGGRIVLFSDGLVEQPSPTGEQFGVLRTLAAVERATTAREDVLCMAQAVREHADSDALADDLTVASVEWRA